MKKTSIKIGLAVLLYSQVSCVSMGVYKDLESKYNDLLSEREQLYTQNQELDTKSNQLENDYNGLRSKFETLVEQEQQQRMEYDAVKSNMQHLEESYRALQENSSQAMATNAKRNRELLQSLEDKKRNLLAEQQKLHRLKKELDGKANRIQELEKAIATKDAAMHQLKNAISKALLDYQGKGLTVEQRDGKIYVSMENKLLFSSGSWVVGPEGKQAIGKLASVLAENPDIAVLIEGHTDNVPYGGNGSIQNNWDLSVKRATSVVQILQQNKAVLASNITAAGRGEFAPVASNESESGKAKNRRIEVILEPKLDEINQLLNQ
ncbi:MAG: OmpA family protein [Flavobacteriaceae bacterium]|nr:OmpA family protein [Flavobacteriaceae bacterium]